MLSCELPKQRWRNANMKRRSLVGIDLTGIEYIPETGEFFRIHKQRNKRQPISPKPTRAGYLRARIDGREVLLHALAYYIMTGEDPNEIDHINRNPSDNRWCNLRNCSRRTNIRNSSLFKGGVGVRKDGKRIRRFEARMMRNGRMFRIGTYHTREEAERAYARTACAMERLAELS